jgi:hypothetical protein
MKNPNKISQCQINSHKQKETVLSQKKKKQEKHENGLRKTTIPDQIKWESKKERYIFPEVEEQKQKPKPLGYNQAKIIFTILKEQKNPNDW